MILDGLRGVAAIMVVWFHIFEAYATSYYFALFFTLIVYWGASGKITDKFTKRICKFLGEFSYPLYVVHYPFIYLYYAWVKMSNLVSENLCPELWRSL